MQKLLVYARGQKNEVNAEGLMQMCVDADKMNERFQISGSSMDGSASSRRECTKTETLVLSHSGSGGRIRLPCRVDRRKQAVLVHTLNH